MWTPPSLLAYNLLENQTWFILMAGLASACVAMFVGLVVLNRRRSLRRPVPKPTSPAKADDPNYDPFLKGSASERRVGLRRGGNAIKVLLTDKEVKGEPVEGWVTDRSTGGLCLVTDEPVDKSTILSVRAANAPETTIWVQIEVKSCREFEGNWELGCQFVRTPPWSVMLLFG